MKTYKRLSRLGRRHGPWLAIFTAALFGMTAMQSYLLDGRFIA